MIVNHFSRLLGTRRQSVRAVAQQTGIAESSLYDLWHDRTTLYARDTLDRLCRALDCQLSDLLEYVPDPPNADSSQGHERGSRNQATG